MLFLITLLSKAATKELFFRYRFLIRRKMRPISANCFHGSWRITLVYRGGFSLWVFWGNIIREYFS